jgi:hypothetical protein
MLIYFTAPTWKSSSERKQAVKRPCDEINGGTDAKHFASACAQRGENTQPLGRLSGRGGWPAIELIGLFTAMV